MARGTIKVVVPDLLRQLGINPEEANVKELSYDLRVDKQTVTKYLRGAGDIKGVHLSTLAAFVEFLGLEDDPLAVGHILRYVKSDGSGT